MMKKRFPTALYNPISMLGAVIAIVNFLVILGLFVYESLFGGLAPYAGIVAFIILPAALIIGLLLIPIGMYFERRRLAQVKDGEQPRSFYIDLGKPSHRLASMIFVSGNLLCKDSLNTGSGSRQVISESG